ncbi:PadR family transcriptional regulator [Paludicola sp. MB14-C6]|uniref:PadR family transcriptional regulator n=1 Tax=Paludihabitans sp. MB14-C6 TaxID=3070656 RepID=UPI0027DBFEF9|nr:PadR family transcriptional regulator [Paludicola sp. MB14-C6]WMJ21817.1 PadR family transcriptional regulator [Paludicola sp. MB14-C6]
MDIQLKKGLLEICVLKVICTEPSYGYKIIGDISQYIEISESTLYPILKRLEQGNCLTTFTQEYNGRLRKYYMITDIGRQRIQLFKQEWQQLKRIYEFIVQEEPLC